MKCEVCLERLEEYLDRELAAADREQVSAHLVTCADCSSMFETLTAEKEIFERYDRELQVPPFLWTRVAQHTIYTNTAPEPGWRTKLARLLVVPSRSLALAVTILLLAIAVGFAYLISSRPSKESRFAVLDEKPPIKSEKIEDNTPRPALNEIGGPEVQPSKRRKLSRVRPTLDRSTLTESDVLSSELAYLDLDDRDTVKHIEQSQILLRSIRNVAVSDADEEIDVTYDKALSRRLLNENVVLRRDAEMKAKFPTKTLLADLEPFLIDIANLPDHARPEDVRVIKERVQKTEIVAALLDYQDRARTVIIQN